jgi:hypothetical protein
MKESPLQRDQPEAQRAILQGLSRLAGGESLN